MRKSSITTECEEVKAAALLITNKPLRHPNIVHPWGLSGKRKAGHGGLCYPRSQNRDLGHPAFVVVFASPGARGTRLSQVSESRPGAPAFWGWSDMNHPSGSWHLGRIHGLRSLRAPRQSPCFVRSTLLCRGPYRRGRLIVRRKPRTPAWSGPPTLSRKTVYWKGLHGR